jgi:Flp pilus assembly protein TadB
MTPLPPPPPDADAYEREVLTTPRPTVRSVVRKYRLALAVPIVMLLVQALALAVLAPWAVAAFWLVFFVLFFKTLLRRERDRWQRRLERALRSIARRRDEDASP